MTAPKEMLASEDLLDLKDELDLMETQEKSVVLFLVISEIQASQGCVVMKENKENLVSLV